MARIIKMHHDFMGDMVVDFGCGYGDMMYYALAAGADYAIGYDEDPSALGYADMKCEDFKNKEFVPRDLMKIMEEDEVAGDVAFCFSVLPYLLRPEAFVNWLGDSFPTVFIECQYRGDGPGNIADDDEGMMEWLLDRGFDVAKVCGKTHVLMRNKYRTIWKGYKWTWEG